MQGKDEYDSHVTIRFYMLSFAEFKDDHTTPCNDQRLKYAEVKYGKYAETGVYTAKGVYVAKGKYIEYAEDVAYVTKGKYGEYAKEDATVEEGHNKPLAKEGDDKPLAKNGNWAGCNNEPLATRAIGCVHHARQQRASRHKGK
jgi:hypothetical protein